MSRQRRRTLARDASFSEQQPPALMQQQQQQQQRRSPPTDARIVQAVQERAEAAVELARNYRHAAWYMLFVGLYMAVLYFQAASFDASRVVAALKAALLDDPSVNTVAFSSGDQVLAYLGNRVVRPAWTDPVCGDGRCEAPWEFPAWGPFGCRADCGTQAAARRVVVAVTGDFTGHASLSARTLMAAASWNLCLDDAARRARGEADLCWFRDDQKFAQSQETQIRAVTLLPGSWYLRVKGDYAGRVGGGVYAVDASNATSADDEVLRPIAMDGAWETCPTKRKRAASAALAATLAANGGGAGGTASGQRRRRLQEAYARLREAAGDDGARALVHKALADAARKVFSSPSSSQPQVE